MMDRHHRGCRNISRSNNRLQQVETAFVGSSFSSAEDLDEVDRLANHPVLRSLPPGAKRRPPPVWRTTLLRKSRSETGGNNKATGLLSVWAGGDDIYNDEYLNRRSYGGSFMHAIKIVRK